MQSHSNPSPNPLVCIRCGADLKGKSRCWQCQCYNDPNRDRVLERRTQANPTQIQNRVADLGEQVRCRVCARFLGSVEGFSGRVTFYCRDCKGRTTVERGPALESRTARVEQLLEEMQARWDEFRVTKLRERGTVAVGLRFRVFQRDGFRCRYCGVSIESGTILHADHVVPESKGGPTTLENLVTACIDCNLGKSDRLLVDAGTFMSDAEPT